MLTGWYKLGMQLLKTYHKLETIPIDCLFNRGIGQDEEYVKV